MSHTYQAVDDSSSKRDLAHSPRAADGVSGTEGGVACKRVTSKLFRKLQHTGHKDRVGVEPNSVYGAACLMPQLARTCSWPQEFISLVISSYVYLILCLVVHGALLVFMSKSESVWDNYSGQMYLCDFGANVQQCEEGDPACMGPGGTTMSPPRMYSWDQWVTRVYVRDALLAVFPDSRDEIRQSVDPGEYGMESYSCRLVCVFVFMITVIEELYLIVRMIRFLLYIPNESQPWLVETESTNAEEETDVQVRVAGMSVFWKLFSASTVLLPKAVLWAMTVDVGVSFLMETDGICDIIVNSVALTFLLTMDETIFEGLMSAKTKYLLSACKDYETGGASKNAAAEPAEEKPLCSRVCGALWNVVNQSCWKLLLTALLTVVFTMHYYGRHCTYVSGRWVSQPMYTPSSTTYNFLNALLPPIFPLAQSKEPYWTMPE
eukprot:TRINITY_DN24642_c0_g2_i2.p1 TRINITY_DN24642_c0_g2~~TRINITY_DN24642_c0_g2_i2.p1  ORF type:complete len:434 (-),score=47.11 TRINITY_DN24642_c0_g2_i2:415-1716(-)